MNYNFKKNLNLKYRCDIINDNNINANIFEEFISCKDQKEYLAFPSETNFNIDIYSSFNKKIIISLIGHKSEIKYIEYFFNHKEDKEYLVSREKEKVIIWEISNNYNKKCIINVTNGMTLSCCLLIFPLDKKENYIVESTIKRDVNNSSLYSLDNGQKIKTINSEFKEFVYYLIPWYNRKNNKYYIIELGFYGLSITNLFDNENYFKFEDDNMHRKGFICKHNNEDYLYCFSPPGGIIVIELNSRKIIKKIYILMPKSISFFSNYFELNNKYIILYPSYFPYIYIYDLKNNKIISKYNIETKYIKKVFHSEYGESLLLMNSKNIIELWTI